MQSAAWFHSWEQPSTGIIIRATSTEFTISFCFARVDHLVSTTRELSTQFQRRFTRTYLVGYACVTALANSAASHIHITISQFPAIPIFKIFRYSCTYLFLFRKTSVLLAILSGCNLGYGAGMRQQLRWQPPTKRHPTVEAGPIV